MSEAAPHRAALARRWVRGLYALADAGAGHGDPVGLGADLLAGGCKLIQLRAKGWSLADIERAARDLQARCAHVGAALVLNDYAAIAHAVDALGVHVGQTDDDTRSVRLALRPHQLIGRSTHTPEQAVLAAGDADYVAFGPVFSSAHAGAAKGVRGLPALAEARRRVGPAACLVAIGGIDADQIPLVRAAGADAWAVIGAVSGAPDRVAATRALVGVSAASR